MSRQILSYNDMFLNFTSQLLQSFQEVDTLDLSSGSQFEFEIHERVHKQKINPMIRLATKEDVDEIISIYKDIYENTYPYKEMEDRKEVSKMLKSPNVEWLIFETSGGEIVGCFTFILDFDNKLGYIRGFVIKKKFLGKVDIIKMAMGSFIAMYRKYYNKIFRWYGECRTAHAKSQYFCAAAGFKPIALYPCKDVFYNKVESDLLIISYDERALREYRSKKIPSILPSVETQFLYSHRKYKLGDYLVKDPKIIINQAKIRKIKKALKISTSIDRFGYTDIHFSIDGSNSYFSFLYTPSVQNFEKTMYKIKNIEELYVFVQEFMNQARKFNVRYVECFISGYEITHQKIFSEVGLRPQGYVPSWRYNKKKESFEDFILFNYYQGSINENMDLIDESKDLLRVLIDEDSVREHQKLIVERFPAYYRIQTKVSKIWDHPRAIKSSIMVGLALFLFFLFDSIFMANFLGQYSYNFITHSISKLGSRRITPYPFMFDIACVMGGITSTLFYCYFSKRIDDTLGENESYKCTKCGFIIGVIGSLGIVFVGIFSLERAPGFWHGLSSLIAFSGFVFSLLIFGVGIIRFNLGVPKSLAVFGFFPLIAFILFLITFIPFFEWILLLSIIGSLIPLFLWVSFN